MVPLDTIVFVGTGGNTDRHWHELCKIIHDVDVFDYPNSPFVSCKEFIDSIYETCGYVWQSGKHNDAG